MKPLLRFFCNFTESTNALLRTNGKKPMKVGEVRKFKIDKTKKKECGLPGDGIIEIEIKKVESNVAKFAFEMVKFEDGAYLQCDDGYIVQVRAEGKAEKCGIAKIMTELCLKEKEMHKAKDEVNNKALLQIDEYIEFCQNQAACSSNDQPLKQLRDLKEWSMSHCSKFIYLIMTAAGNGAHVYFNSAIASGYTEMFMMGDFTNVQLALKNNREGFYPQEGPCTVKTLQERYREDRTMVDGDEKTSVGDWNWFFCHPKKANPQKKCSIL